MGFLSIDLERRFGEFVGAGIGYNFHGLRLTAKDDDLGGEFDLRFHGPKIYVSLSF